VRKYPNDPKEQLGCFHALDLDDGQHVLVSGRNWVVVEGWLSRASPSPVKLRPGDPQVANYSARPAKRPYTWSNIQARKKAPNASSLNTLLMKSPCFSWRLTRASSRASWKETLKLLRVPAHDGHDSGAMADTVPMA